MRFLARTEVDMQGLLEGSAARAAKYSASTGRMPVSPQPRDIARLDALGGALPQNPSDPKETLALLDDIGSPATVASQASPAQTHLSGSHSHSLACLSR